MQMLRMLCPSSGIHTSLQLIVFQLHSAIDVPQCGHGSNMTVFLLTNARLKLANFYHAYQQSSGHICLANHMCNFESILKCWTQIMPIRVDTVLAVFTVNWKILNFPSNRNSGTPCIVIHVLGWSLRIDFSQNAVGIGIIAREGVFGAIPIGYGIVYSSITIPECRF